MLASATHEANAMSPILVTLLGIITLVKLLQPSKALWPMNGTFFDMVILVKLVLP